MKVRNIRQVISTLLTTALLFSLMSMSAFAADTTVDLSFDVPDLSVQNYNSKEAFLDNYASTAAPLSSNSNTSTHPSPIFIFLEMVILFCSVFL